MSCRSVKAHLLTLRRRINTLRAMERFLRKPEVEASAHLPKFWELVRDDDIVGLRILLEHASGADLETKSVRALRLIASDLKIPHYGTMLRERLIQAIHEETHLPRDSKIVCHDGGRTIGVRIK